ncbi:hypothetical protein Syun_006701 [Stephania yunnanensis]|uniref:Uncharacterized protein n=1 Tax=Stephania yunnanensis TaxID=152371 RepID=A0AAP0PYR4_9MAGN
MRSDVDLVKTKETVAVVCIVVIGFGLESEKGEVDEDELLWWWRCYCFLIDECCCCYLSFIGLMRLVLKMGLFKHKKICKLKLRTSAMAAVPEVSRRG